MDAAQAKIAQIFEAIGLNGAKMETFDNPGPLEPLLHCTMTPGTNPFEHSPCRQSLRIHAHSIIFWHSNYLILVHLGFPWHKWFLLVLRPLPLNRRLLLTFAILPNRFRFCSTDGSRLQGCLALVPPYNAFGFQPPADQFSDLNSAEEMLVRKSTNGETWVQHVLEGLTSNFESII